jgi:hypothetical protein
LAIVPAAEPLQPALASTRLNSWSGGSGAPASTLPRKEQAPLWSGPQKPRDRGCRFATRLCSAWTAREYMPCQEKRLQGVVPRDTGSLYYHEVILVTMASGYATRFSLCGASAALIELWARIQASVPRPHSLPWSRLARSIYELCLAGACFASRFSLASIVGCYMDGARPNQKKTENKRETHRGSTYVQGAASSHSGR